MRSSVVTGSRPKGSRAGRAGWPALVALLVLAAFAVGPIVIFLFDAVKTQAELAANPLGLPTHPQWSNFADAWDQASMGTGLLNSLMIVALTVIGTCIVSASAAYAMARLDLPGSGAVIAYLLITSALPIVLFITPLFYLWTNLHLYDSRIGLALIYIGVFSPFGTLLMRSFLISLPVEYEEAARNDGAGEVRVLWSVVIPLSWPGLLSVALVTALAAYNEFLFAVTFIQDPDKLPVSISLYSFRIGGYLQDQTLINAAGVIMMVPVVVLFLALQRRFVAGMASSGLVA